jgi:hypothetical protein
MESPVKSQAERSAVGMGVHSAAVPTLAAIDVDTRGPGPHLGHRGLHCPLAASAHDRDEYAQIRSEKGG